jgi:hypothetical protein
MVASIERIGVILVHGIGEQRRLQHLDSQLRDLISALRDMQTMPNAPVRHIGVDIPGSDAAVFKAEQDTWTAGAEPSVTIVVHHTMNGAAQETRLQVHEVWWADVNEPYSLAKQFRFWLWGLAIWAHPGKPRSALRTADRVAPPVVPAERWLYDRARLFLVGAFFALLGFSIGVLTFLANRLLLWQTPDVLRVMANYISAVKLYNQSGRYGPGLLWQREDFLDSVGEPPRVSVRRRMIRTIADVACNNYDRWYVLAHSQGAVVAFNGLMETAYAWPGYLNQGRWVRLCQARLAGPGRAGMPIPPATQRIMPRRPAWLTPNEIAYRSRIFSRFQGLLTYGAPLEKFAGIWPALVPISRERTFRSNVRWLNIHDPVDPVSGRLLAFQAQPVECCPRAENFGYAASWWLLLAHLKYLTHRKPQPDVARATVRWLLTDDTSDFQRADTGLRTGTWFTWAGRQRWLRQLVAMASWLVVTIGLLLLGAIILPMLLEAVVAALGVIGKAVVALAPWVGRVADGLAKPFTWVSAPVAWLANLITDYWPRVAVLAVSALLLALIVGAVHRLWTWLFPDASNPSRPGIVAGQPPQPMPQDPGFSLDSDEPADI